MEGAGADGTEKNKSINANIQQVLSLEMKKIVIFIAIIFYYKYCCCPTMFARRRI
jgi:hypothetical protein